MIVPVQVWFDGGSLVRIGQRKGIHSSLQHPFQQENRVRSEVERKL